MRHDGTLKGLWIVRTDDTPPSPGTLMGRVQEELYVLAFTNAPKASACVSALGATGRPFYVCAANIEQVVGQVRGEGARGFILDYDAAGAKFVSAHSLPAEEFRDAR